MSVEGEGAKYVAKKRQGAHRGQDPYGGGEGSLDVSREGSTEHTLVFHLVS